jgi:hypothetical protein
MAGTSRPDGIEEKEAFAVGLILGVMVGICLGAVAVSWGK